VNQTELADCPYDVAGERPRGSLARGEEAQVVGAEVLRSAHVVQGVIARVETDVDVGVDETGDDEPAVRFDRPVDRCRILLPHEANDVPLQEDDSTLEDPMLASVEGDDGPTLEQRLHAPLLDRCRAA
jgi:hypothetical protein